MEVNTIFEFIKQLFAVKEEVNEKQTELNLKPNTNKYDTSDGIAREHSLVKSNVFVEETFKEDDLYIEDFLKKMNYKIIKHENISERKNEKRIYFKILVGEETGDVNIITLSQHLVRKELIEFREDKNHKMSLFKGVNIDYVYKDTEEHKEHSNYLSEAGYIPIFSSK